MKTREIHEKIVQYLRQWQKIENASVSSTGRVLEKTDHPLIRLVMEIIQRDSQAHYNIQQMIIDSFERKVMTLTPEDVAEVWELIEEHVALEKKTVELANEALSTIKGMKYLTSQLYLLRYMLADEEKHNFMLEGLENVKKDLYPYN